MSTNPVAAYQAAHPATPAEWPWAEIDGESERLFRELQVRVVQIMKDAGEDPDNAQLFSDRCAQVAYGIDHRVRGMRS